MKLLSSLLCGLLFVYGLLGQNDTLSIEEQFYKAHSSLVLLKNDQHIVPIDQLDGGPIALVGVGLTAGCDLQTILQSYTKVVALPFPKFQTPTEAEAWVEQKLSKYRAVVLGINDYDFAGVAPYTTHRFFIQEVLKLKNVISVVFGGAKVFSVTPQIIQQSSAVLLSPFSEFAHGLAAQAIMGGIGVEGVIQNLPKGLDLSNREKYKTEAVGRLRFGPAELMGMNSQLLRDSIGKIVEEGLTKKAYPGAQVLVIKSGQVVFHETYGHHTYDTLVKVKKTDLFDYASLTKVTSALPALIRLHGEGKFDLDATLESYMPYFKGSNKGELTFRNMLAHNARLRPWIPYWRSTIKGNKNYPWKKGWTNNNYNNYQFKRKTLSQDSTDKFNVRITDKLWLHRNYKKKIYKSIKRSPLNEQPGYVYSGLLFYLLPELVSEITQEDFESYLKQHIYHPMGAYTITYNPYLHFVKERIVPTENDTFFRLNQLQGTVHDEGAAMMGGVSANAGLFSTAIDLGKLMQAYLNMGQFGNRAIFAPESVQEFTRCQYCSEGNRRGLGFDKPLIEYNVQASSVAKDASPWSFGHSGYTGTFAWVDPKNELIFIFFSNRVYPTRDNRKLYQLNIRPRIHQVLYDAIEQKGN